MAMLSTPQESQPVFKATVDDMGAGENLPVYTSALANITPTPNTPTPY